MDLSFTKNRKTVFTRMCISEAICALLKTTEFAKLKISDIVKRAGVARMTFYKYYDSTNSALKDYMGIVVAEYLEKCGDSISSSTYMSQENIEQALLFFDQYAEYFLTLKAKGLYGIMVEGINSFMEEHVLTQEHVSEYQIYAYAGGLLNTFLKWEENGKKETAEEVAKTLHNLYNTISV